MNISTMNTTSAVSGMGGCQGSQCGQGALDVNAQQQPKGSQRLEQLLQACQGPSCGQGCGSAGGQGGEELLRLLKTLLQKMSMSGQSNMPGLAQ